MDGYLLPFAALKRIKRAAQIHQNVGPRQSCRRKKTSRNFVCSKATAHNTHSIHRWLYRNWMTSDSFTTAHSADIVTVCVCPQKKKKKRMNGTHWQWGKLRKPSMKAATWVCKQDIRFTCELLPPLTHVFSGGGGGGKRLFDANTRALVTLSVKAHVICKNSHRFPADKK